MLAGWLVALAEPDVRTGPGEWAAGRQRDVARRRARLGEVVVRGAGAGHEQRVGEAAVRVGEHQPRAVGALLPARQCLLRTVVNERARAVEDVVVAGEFAHAAGREMDERARV